MNRRAALIRGALYGWKGSKPCAWLSPYDVETIICWAGSYCSAETEDRELLKAFEELESEGLFFEVHAGLFKSPTYYCSFEPRFLQELAVGSGTLDLWKKWGSDFDRAYSAKWRRFGLCAGQGEYRPQSRSFGICLGKACDWYLRGEPTCDRGREFAERRLLASGC